LGTRRVEALGLSVRTDTCTKIGLSRYARPTCGWRARPSACGSPRVFRCSGECGDDGCDELFLMSLWDFRSAHDAFVTAPGHRIENARSVRREPEFWLHRCD
jgi:hypothetical protein